MSRGRPKVGAAATRVEIGSATLALGLSLASALLVVAALPPIGLWPLIWIAFVPVVIGQYLVPTAARAGILLWAMVSIYFVFYDLSAFPAAAAALVLGVAILTSPVLAVGWLGRRLNQATGFAAFCLLEPLALTGLDALRDLTGGGAGNWADPAVALTSQPWLLQPISVLGAATLNLVILVVN